MAVKANIIIDQGSDFKTELNITNDFGDPVDLSGYTGVAQMRRHYTSVKFYSFAVTIDEDNGTVILSMDSDTTDSIPAGRYVYDCELSYLDGTKSRIVEGIVTVTPQVTR